MLGDDGTRLGRLRAVSARKLNKTHATADDAPKVFLLHFSFASLNRDQGMQHMQIDGPVVDSQQPLIDFDLLVITEGFKCEFEATLL